MYRTFKAVAKMVKNQIVWTKGLAQDAEEHLKTYVVPNSTHGETETLTFNVHAFRPEVQSCGGLSQRAKAILRKHSWARTEGDLKLLHRFTVRLKCFDRYPIYVRKDLASVLYYQAFENGRVVIRQGDIGFSFYFIISGSVLVEVQEEDQTTGKKHNMVVGELGSGASFGELALLHDDCRRATIVCNETSEFLKIDRPDFDMVLRRNHEREWNTRMAHFKSHPLFTGWSETNLNFAVEGSQITEYPPNTVILKDLTAPTEKVYFIIHGACRVVQKVALLEDRHRQRLILPPISAEPRDPTQQRAEEGDARHVQKVKKWWVLRTLQQGDYFGVGEGQPGTAVISDHKVECLLVNKMVFMKQERGRCLSRMKTQASSLYPSRNTAFRSFLEATRWKDYKKQVVLETVKKQRRPHTTTLADVPRVLMQ